MHIYFIQSGYFSFDLAWMYFLYYDQSKKKKKTPLYWMLWLPKMAWPDIWLTSDRSDDLTCLILFSFFPRHSNLRLAWNLKVTTWGLLVTWTYLTYSHICQKQKTQWKLWVSNFMWLVISYILTCFSWIPMKVILS